MALIKKNIWLIFYVFTLFFLILFATLSYLSWKNIYKDYQTTQENMVKLIADSTRSLFKTQETILNIVGNRFLEDENYKNNPRAMTTLNATLIDNPSIDAIALVKPNGTMTFVSGGYDVTKFPNLLEQKASRDSFLATLQSTKMVFGRTYYFKPIEQWITPIRKAIRDQNGHIVTIITAALRVKDSFGSFGVNSDKEYKHNIAILRDEDFYFQYISNDTIDNTVAYSAPMPLKEREAIQNAIMKTHHFTMDQFKEYEYLVSFANTDLNGKQFLTSLQYDKTYKLWISASIPLNIIIKDFLQRFSIYAIIFMFISAIFFFLFRTIAKADDKRNADLIFQATHDQLTNLPNRSYLQKNINDWLYKDLPSFSILYIDLDHFKNINDNFGHQYGDYLLVELSKRLKAVTPHDATIVRHGGDEFVIFTYITHDENLLSLANTIIETISQPYYINQLTLIIGASIGISKYPDHGESIDTLLRAADIAMYESKKIHNHAHIFHDTLQESYLKNIKIEHELRKAIEHDELSMVYQPQIDHTGNIYGVEALVRWQNSTLGMVPPDQFISVAETSGQMVKIGHFIIARTLKEIKEVQTTLGGIRFQTSINISVRQFMEVAFLEQLLEAIKEYKMNQIAVTIEITENLLIEDIDYIIPLLHEIRKWGIQISMDDFGTGYSSLNMLRKLPIDELKIDKSFIDTIVEDETAQTMVQNIIAIGKNFNMHVLAEGVETKEQRALLTSFRCDRFQGYYFAKPLCKNDLITFFQKYQNERT